EPSAAIVDGVGGRIPADFGCSMMLASLAKASGSSNRSNVSSALATVLAELPENLRNTVRARLQELYGGDAVGEAIALRDIAMKFRLREPENESAAGDIPSRVAFWRSDDDIRAAAITNTATVTERATPRRAPLVEQGHERLQQHAAAMTNTATVTKRATPRRAPLVEQGHERLHQQPDTRSFEEDARSLCRLLIPTELKEVFKRPESLVIEVDRVLARVQWEALPAGLDGQPLAVVRSVARQLRTFYSPRPFQVVASLQLKALVIGDPGPAEFVLEAARDEAVEVANLLCKRCVKTTLLVGAPEDGTGAGVLEDVRPADYFEVVSRLLKGEFDIVHYSGHATFDRQYPDRTGWVFKDGVLTAHELEGMERPPRLIFANACLSSQLAPQSARAQSNAAQPPAVKNPSRGDSALVASLADEFLKQGVADYIGSAWEIPSIPAALFATKFYDALFAQDGGKLGSALLDARKELYQQRTKFGAAWAAYQHYGDPARSISPGPQ
ncbi:MAG: CHAT domain-containing protein, partial [Burkholderiales bacterium]